MEHGGICKEVFLKGNPEILFTKRERDICIYIYIYILFFGRKKSTPHFYGAKSSSPPLFWIARKTAGI